MCVRVKLSLIAAFVLMGTCLSAQCNWLGRLGQAIEERYSRDDSACKILQIPPQEFNDQWSAMVESRILAQHQLLNDPEQPRLEEIAQRYLRYAGVNGMFEPVAISSDAVPNAFATGQHVTLHEGIIEWYLRPQNTLQRSGVNYAQTQQFIAAYGSQNPGELGLLAILAHETAHNILGHPDAFSMSQACNRYIDNSVRDIHDYEAEIATGKRPGGFKSAMKNTLLGFAQTFGDTQEQQEHESQADRLGAWLVWKETGDPFAMAKALRWLSVYTGGPTSTSGAVLESLCSNHPMLLQRIAAVESQAYTMNASQFPSGLKRAPIQNVRVRYEQYVKWSDAVKENSERIAHGDLTDEERTIQKRIHLETKPKKAHVSIDGAPELQVPADIQLRLGPHNLRIQSEEITWDQQVVVLPDAPEKMKIERPKR
jgi:predicted Zn-dependent protease